MHELKRFKLPLLVEARRKEREEAMATADLDQNPSPSPSPSPRSLQLMMTVSSSTISAEIPSPTTPTFSVRGHSRLPSSNSSLASSPIIRESMDGFGSQKRPLTEVKEEPHERDSDYEMIDTKDEIGDEPGTIFFSALANSRRREDESLPSADDYDLADDVRSDPDWRLASPLKRHRASDSALHNLTLRFGTRMPSLSQKWRNRKTSNPGRSEDSPTDLSLSRANSTRAPSLAGSMGEHAGLPDPQLPLTPTKSIVHGDPNEGPIEPIDIDRANAVQESEYDEGTATTPLLPPIIAQFPSQLEDVPFQSPLQSPSVAPSPTVAECDSPFSLPNPMHAAKFPGLPSPPLSSRPSIASFHRQRSLGPAAATENPPILMTDSQDEWSIKLGHANFTILPEPYLPVDFDVVLCERLRSDWNLARCKYTKHLVRTGEHYGATSKIHRLTEEKWAEIEALWKRNYDLYRSRAIDSGQEAELSKSQCSVPGPNPLMIIPSLNGFHSEGKFPKLGDEEIVGPMEQVASQMQQRRSSRRRAGILKFLHGVLPSSVGWFSRSVQSRSSSP